MPSAKNISNRRKLILVYGPTGSGKSTLFKTIPGKKFCYCFDPSTLDTIAGSDDIDFMPFLPQFDISIGRTSAKRKSDPARKDKKFTEPTVYMDFQTHVEDWINGEADEDGNRLDDYDVLGINSLTMLQYSTLQRVLWINGRPIEVPELSDYMIVGDTLLRMIGALTGRFNGILFIEAHDDTFQDKTTHKVFNKLDLYKNLRREMPRLLTDVLVASGASSIEGNKWTIQTGSSKEYPMCKNSMGMKFIEDVTVKGNNLEGQGLGRFIK